jgi:phage/plasmid-like protein (TIGR03299 family)
MSHELEIIEGQASFAYNRQNGNPWHRLGVAMDGLGTADEMLAAARADYTVSTAPIYVLTPDGFQESATHKATIRPVADGTQTLGIVGKGYEVMQNRVALQTALSIVAAADNDAVVDTAGVLFEGRRFFAYIDLGTLVIDPLGINDRITRGLGVLTSHDGTMSLTCAMSNIRWVCNNTVTAGVAAAQRTFRARHTANMTVRMEEARKVLGVSVGWAEKFQQAAEKLNATPGGMPVLEATVNHLWPKADADTARKQANWDDRFEQMVSLYNGPTNAGGFGHTAWSVYNTVGEYADHFRSSNPVKLAEASIADGNIVSQVKDRAEKFLLTV